MQRQHLADALLPQMALKGMNLLGPVGLTRPPHSEGERSAGSDGAAAQASQAAEAGQGQDQRPGPVQAHRGPGAESSQLALASSAWRGFTPHQRAMNTASTALTCCMLEIDTHSSMPWMSEPLGP